LIMGSEGRAGIVAEATVRITRHPAVEKFAAVLFPHWDGAVATARNLARSELCLSMMRVSDPRETVVQLGMAGANPALKLLPGWPQRCLMLMAFTSDSRISAERDRWRAWTEARRNAGLPLPGPFGEKWREKRFSGAYLRNSLWDLGYAVDTLETCLSWSKLESAKTAIEGGIREALREQGYVFSHLSHFYSSGCSLYTTYLFPLAAEESELRQRWLRAKAAASEAIMAHGGTISHQHGVGLDHKPYLQTEKGRLALDSLEAGLSTFDKLGMMNPGKLL
jgi:alkyldihydroxyacetonephosphate synthase